MKTYWAPTLRQVIITIATLSILIILDEAFDQIEMVREEAQVATDLAERALSKTRDQDDDKASTDDLESLKDDVEGLKDDLEDLTNDVRSLEMETRLYRHQH